MSTISKLQTIDSRIHDDEIIVSENFIKCNINISNINASIRKIFKISVIPKIINVSKPSNSSAILMVVVLKFRILYLVDGNSEIQIFSDYNIKEVEIKTPKAFDIRHIENNSKAIDLFNIEVKKTKSVIESSVSISTNFWTTITLKYNQLGDYWFRAEFDSMSDNIFYWNNSEKRLVQQTFFSNNKIESLAFSNGTGYVLSKEQNKKNIYYIEKNKISRIPLNNVDGEILYIARLLNNNLIAVIKNEDDINLYRYNYGNFQLFIGYICKELTPITLDNSIIYGKEDLGIIKIMRTFYKEEDNNLIKLRDEVIFECNDEINSIKVSKDRSYISILVNHQYIYIYNLITNTINMLNINAIGNEVEDIFFTYEKNIIILKIIEGKLNNLKVFYLDKEFHENLTTNYKDNNISSVFINNQMTSVYFSDDTMYGYNIYKVNLKTLNRELLLELNANSIEFIE